MSVLQNKQIKCSVCGYSSEQVVVCSTNQIGSPDLDLRPPQMERSTLQYHVQECPFCSYANRSIELKPPKGMTLDWLRSEAYQSCDKLNLISMQEKKFYHYYLICKKQNRLANLFYALRDTIWICDDNNDSEIASFLRIKAAPMARKLYKRTLNPIYKVIECDMLRRAGKFDEVKSFNHVFTFRDRRLLNQILDYERKKAAECNSCCFTIAEVLEENAT